MNSKKMGRGVRGVGSMATVDVLASDRRGPSFIVKGTEGEDSTEAGEFVDMVGRGE